MIKDRPIIDAGLFQALHDPQGYGKYFEIVRAIPLPTYNPVM